VTSNLFAQKEIKGYIFDRKTNESIAYAILSASNNNYGTYADSLGYFKFNYSSEKDSIRITHLGYKPIMVNLNSLKNDPRIYLDPNPIGLNDVVVKATKMKRKEIKIGNLKNKEAVWLVPSYATIFATYIPFPKNENNLTLNSISLKLHLTDKNYPLRIRLFNVGNDGKPSEDILKENVILKAFDKVNTNYTAVVDISKYNIKMPNEGVFVALEWIDLEGSAKDMKAAGKNGPYVFSTRHIKIYNTRWVKFYYQNSWQKRPDNSTIAICLIATKFYK
jgi:hypothetical protein